eukprot:3775673-Amphidinium_carterae.1
MSQEGFGPRSTSVDSMRAAVQIILSAKAPKSTCEWRGNCEWLAVLVGCSSQEIDPRLADVSIPCAYATDLVNP